MSAVSEAPAGAESGAQMQKWICVICGFIYDPAIGMPQHGIAPGIAFEDLPDDWTCPECGSPKSAFEPYEE